MKAGYVIRDQERPHFITITVVDWIDILTRKMIAKSSVTVSASALKTKA